MSRWSPALRSQRRVLPSPPPRSPQPPKALLGKWVNAGEQDQGTLEFFPDGSLAVVLADRRRVSLALSVSSPTAVIHYTLNATEPTEASPFYSAPIVTNASIVVRAKVFDPGLQPSATVSQNYTLLGSDVVNFNSNLPLIIINTFGRSVPDGLKIPANARFIDTLGGRASLTGAADYARRLFPNDSRSGSEADAVFRVPTSRHWKIRGTPR